MSDRSETIAANDPNGTKLVIRPAIADDVPLVLALITELAEYEQMADQMVATEADVHRALFGTPRYAEAVIASLGETPVGFALFFHSFSTFLAKPGLYLEDLYVKPGFRGQGSAGGCWRTWHGSPRAGITVGSSGRCSTGTIWRSGHIGGRVRCRWTSGRCIG